jgi:hypothetical protein
VAGQLFSELGGGDFHVVPDESSQERFSHLAATGVVLTNEQDERLQELLLRDDVA